MARRLSVLIDTEAPASDAANTEARRVSFGPGPLGVTFTWREDIQCFAIQSFPSIPGTDREGPGAGKGQLQIGDALVALDDTDLQGLPSDRVIALMRSREASQRVLSFRQCASQPPLVRVLHEGDPTDPTNLPVSPLSTASKPPPPQAAATPLPPPGLSARSPEKGPVSARNTARKDAGLTWRDEANSNTARSGHSVQASLFSSRAGTLALQTGRAGGVSKPLPKVFSHVQVQLEECLRGDAALAALHVEVQNLSYWYQARHVIGPRRHMHHGIKWDKKKEAWEAYIYTNRYSAAHERVEVGKKSLGHFATQAKAFRKCEEVIKLRDGNPAENNDGTRPPMTPEAVLRTHFRVMVVSREFDGKDRMERMAVVIYALLKGLHTPERLPPGGSAFATADRRRMRGFSGAVGDRVMALPIFRDLSVLGGASLLLECKTPSQWLPDAMGGVHDHDHITKIAAIDAKLASEEANAQRLKMLLFGTRRDRKGRIYLKAPKSPGALKKKPGTAEMLGVVVETDGPTGGRKVGGIFGHFFHDADPHTRQHVMHEYNHNIHALHAAQQKGPSPAHSPSHAATSTALGASAPLAATVASLASSSNVSLAASVNTVNTGNDSASNSKDAQGKNVELAGSRRASLVVTTALAATSQSSATPALAVTTALSPAGKPAAPQTTPAHTSKTNNVQSLMDAFKNDLVYETAADRTAKDMEVITKYQMANRSLKGIARRLQRIHRSSGFCRAFRRVWRHEKAALTIQRVVRGHYARCYFRLLKVVYDVACTKIQSNYRGVLARRWVMEKLTIEYAAQATIAKVYRGRLTRRYVAWVRGYEHAAVMIETLVRGFLGRCRFKHLRAVVMTDKVFTPSAIVIQRCYRGYLGRRWVKEFTFERLHMLVVVPCAICIQRHVRGYWGRLIGAAKRKLHRQISVIQGLVRGFLSRGSVKRIRLRILRYHMAVQIQRIVRGYMDRKVIRRRREKMYRLKVMVPSATRIQACIRGHLKRKEVTVRRQHWFAALRIQSQWRAYRARTETLELWKQMREEFKKRAVVIIQTNWRGFLGRRAGRQLRLDTEGRRLYAARIIMRAILRSMYSRRFRKLKERWEVEQSAQLLLEIDEEKQNVRDDMEDIDIDIKMMRRRIKRFGRRVNDLKDFKKEAGRRIPQVEAELDDLDIEDIEGGWGEALEAEWESLSNRLNLVTEETRQLKMHIRTAQDDIAKLQMERDDYEMDMERFQMREVLEYELLGRMEIERAGRQADEDFRRKVYRQKCRWKDSSTRRKVIARSLDYLPEMQQKIKGRRTVTVMGTTSSEKHMDREDEEAFLLNLMTQRERRRRAKEINSKGYRNQELANTFDSVVSTTLDVVKGATYMLRHPVNDLREDPRAVCRECGKVFCHCKGSVCYSAVKKMDMDEDGEGEG